MFLRIIPNNVEEFFDVEAGTKEVNKGDVVFCSKCNESIASLVGPEEVCSVANMLGWAYDNVQGRIICNKCFKEEQEGPVGK